MNKKLISSLLTVAMAINIFAIMPLNAFAIGSKSEVYEKDGYTVTYRIGSDWDNNRSVEVTIENTGDEAILNWALKYDTGGEVYNLWNSKIYDSTEEYTIIKNNGYNYEIEPGRSANYGYIVTGAETLIPENIELCCRRIDVKSGYDVDFSITNNWHTGFQAEIAITNTSAEPIEAWTLDFDSNFDINNIWNAKLLSSEEQSYVTANQLWTTPINPGASASFGFTADKSATENAWAENFTLTAVVVGESVLEKEPEIDYELDTDSDGLPDYYEEIIGSDPKTEHSDDDQLPDGYEALYLGTGPSKSDSDDNGISDADEDFDADGLTNLEEYNLGTDPFLEDSDYDTLSDKDEVNIHSTNPTKSDTDDDLVPDGDEVKLGLDPNSGSTNGTPDSERTFPQIVTAESEVLAAVNDDEETPFDVSLEITAAGVAESNVYARESGYSNAIENPSIIGIAPEFVYTDGLEVEEVTVKFELDDSIVDNTLGTYVSSSTEFEGIKRLNVFMFFEDVNMLLPVETFHDEATNTVYTTTDRMGTYCLVDMELFFDNLDIAPSDDEIEEDYDIETQEFLDEPVFSSYNISELKINTGYTEYKDNFDVAFVIDEVSYNESQLEAIKKEIQEVSEIIFKYSDNVTISVYGLNGYGQTHSSWYGRIDNAENINALLNKVANKEITTVDGYVHISECIDYITAAHKSSESLAEREEYCFIFFNPLHTNSKLTQVNDNKDDEEIDSVFQFLGLSSRTDEYGMAILDRINREGTDINFSTITNSFAAVESGKYSKAMSEMTGGKNIDAVSYESVVTECIEHIYGEIPENVNAYKAIIATGYSTVVLDKPLTQQEMENARNLLHPIGETSDYEFSEEELEECADTDDDGLWDFEEVMFFLYGNPVISLNEYDELMLPTVGEVLGETQDDKTNYFKAFSESAYVEAGRKKSEQMYGTCFEEFKRLYVLPIYSDPTHEDGDGDGSPDLIDTKKLIRNSNECFFEYLIRDNVIASDDLVKSDDGLIICKKSICDILTDSQFSIKTLPNYCGYNFGEGEIKKYLSDWYITMVKKDDEVSFSGIKIVTQGDCKTSVSFRSFNPMALYFIEDNYDEYLRNIMIELYNLLYKDGICHDNIQYEYYAGICSKGEYNIADVFVDKVLGSINLLTDENGKYFEFSYNLSKQRNNYLKIISKFVEAEKIVKMYEDNSNVIYKIYVDNKDNPTIADKNCIIAAYCGNSSYSSYAAEISLHADKLNGSLIGTIMYANVIVADMTCYKSHSDWYVESELKEYEVNQREHNGDEYDIL